MSGLFEHLAVIDDTRRTASRKALAVARARANKQFAPFLAGSQHEEDRNARLAMVAGDLQTMVKQACADHGCEDWEGVYQAVSNSLGFTVEARRPKMCPVHREVVDISLGSGDPQAGFNAMSGQLLGEQSCRGGFDGTCNFKPEMVTQTFWDKKAEEAEERRQQREQERQQEPQTQIQEVEEPVEQPELETGEQLSEAPGETLDNDFDWDAGDSMEVGEPQMAMAASRQSATVPRAMIHGGNSRELLMIDQKKPGGTINGLPITEFVNQHDGMPLENVEISHPDPNWDRVLSEIASTGTGQPLKDYMEQVRQRKQQQQAPAQPQAQPEVQPEGQLQQPQAATRQSEALKTIDVEQPSGPSPKMDKRKWTPENVSFLDSEESGSPHPTREQDVSQSASYEGKTPFEDDGRFEQTRAVTETQDLPAANNDGFSKKKNVDNAGQSDVFPKGNQAPPVTSATDPDKNPIRESLELDFLSDDEVDQAIRTYKGE